MNAWSTAIMEIPGKLRSMSRIQLLDVFITLISVIWVIYQFLYIFLVMQDGIKHANTHLGFAFLIMLLGLIVKSQKFWPLKLIMTALALFCVLYVQIKYDDLVQRITRNTTLDLIVGIILVILVIIASYQATGWILPILITIFLLYAFFGYLIPGPMQSPKLDWQLIVTRLSLSFGIAGIYGYLLSISATIVFVYMIFAALVTTTGAVNFFHLIGNWVQNHFRSGPAMAAVVSSALVGSICGLPGPIVMITGSFTIPAMKKAGYSPHQAGAIEVAASTSGPIMPPVMGTVAFIMVGFTGIAYFSICLASIIPAILYVISLALYVIFQARRMKIQQPPKIAIDKKELLRMTPIFILPLAVLTILLLLQYSPALSAFWGTLSLIIVSFFRKKTRPPFLAFIKGLRTGCDIASKIAVMCAALGVVIVIVTMTGIGMKLPNLVADISGGNLLITAALAWIICLILGCGLPESAAYLIVAMTCAPIMVKMGVPLLQAHLFVLFAACFANLTPPIAIPAMFASQLAGASYMKTAIESAKAGLAGFLLPFMIIFIPALTLNFSDPIFSITGILSCLLIFFALQIGIMGFYNKSLNPFERICLFISAGIFFAYIYNRNILLFLGGIVILAIFLVWQMYAAKKTAQIYIPSNN